MDIQKKMAIKVTAIALFLGLTACLSTMPTTVNAPQPSPEIADTQSASEMTNQAPGEIDEPIRHASGVHQVSRQNEKRNGQKRKGTDSGRNLLNKQLDRHAGDEQPDDGSNGHAERDRNSQQCQQ